ncbi:hypothetical protein BV898_19126 [Hypsibius exemplaris]|uniref:Uncharacterized protein n=1 Tax=Hypsibius exemplaris TaxID=2072580 RepID=A0A9X6RPF7_HYPEX|nr:hypothetical protein BV898_19126 [Hypsibius exemplaris]
MEKLTEKYLAAGISSWRDAAAKYLTDMFSQETLANSCPTEEGAKQYLDKKGNKKPPLNPVRIKILREVEREKRGIFKPAEKLGPQCLPSKRTKDLIRKVDAATDVDNPPTLDQMAERSDVSKRKIRRVLNKDLQLDLLKKTKTQALSNKQALQRLDSGPRFFKLLGGDRWKYVVSFDEFWLFMNDCGGIRDCYYRKKGKPVPENRTKKWKHKFPKKVMCAAGVSYRNATAIYFIPPTSKVYLAFFFNNVASSHTTLSVYSYPQSKNVKYIGKEDWMANSPDLSPMNFGPNGIFKKSMFKKKPKAIPDFVNYFVNKNTAKKEEIPGKGKVTSRIHCATKQAREKFDLLESQQ